MALSFSTADLTEDERDRLDDIRKKKVELIDEIQEIEDELRQVNTQIEALDSFADDSQVRLKQLACGRRKFNLDPVKGLRYLFDHHLLVESADAVAKFLVECDGLKKSAVGAYLGENHAFNLEVLEEYVRVQDFRSRPLVDALRQFMWRFRLPGEAQKIDRIMEQFARHYCQHNPHAFDHHDSCYALCFATIMLNTALHNPSVKEGMTLDAFHHLTAEISGVGREAVVAIYNSIRAEPFKFPGDDSSELLASTTNLLQHADKQGWLTKQGGRYKAVWNRRWFVLHGKCLYYFEQCGDREPRGIVPLDNLRVRVVTTEDGWTPRLHTFEIYPPRENEKIKACKRADSEGRLVQGQHQVYRMAARDQQEMLSWITAIQRAITRDRYLELIHARRKRISAGASDPTLNRFN